MKGLYCTLFLVLLGCSNKMPESTAPSTKSEIFLSEYTPAGKLAHAGIFSPDEKSFYLTISNSDFEKFDILVSLLVNDHWSEPKPAFFNSEYNEHGIGFSSDGKTLFFSSTRPVGIEGIPETWHIWRCRKQQNGWSEPEFVSLPGMETKLVSHPTLTKSGRMYFHSGSLDYSDLSLFYSDYKENQLSEVKPVVFLTEPNGIMITPFIAPDETYLIFSQVISQKEILLVSKKSPAGWSAPLPLLTQPEKANMSNPFISRNQDYLYYARGENDVNGSPTIWQIHRMKIKAEVYPFH
ncbi:MAG: hypothetical protein ABJF11_08335 [Reichenbachiella sp.]|uniref:hypothetical protein n=1 Tax=Reichenbachiella sp. TaxID=2184521 RepID=UPI00326694B7